MRTIESNTSPLAAALHSQMTATPGAPALWIGRSAFVSFEDLRSLSGDVSMAITELGLDEGARIAISVPRGNAAVVGFLAAADVCTVCPLDGRLKQIEYLDALEALDADLLLTSGVEGPAESAARALGISVLSYQVDFERMVCTVKSIPLDRPSTRARRLDLKFSDGSPPAVLMRTSGTTGQPKIVGLSGENILSAAAVMKHVFRLVPEDVCVTPMPLHHVHGLVAGALSALLAGSSIHCCESFSPEAFDTALLDFSPTWITASPALHLAMRDFYEHHQRRPNAPRLTRFRSSSAPLAASTIESLEALFNAPLIETYGLTETASTICSNPLPPAQRKQGSVGIAVDADLVIVDDFGNAAKRGEIGEITLQGPGVISEYLGAVPPDAFLHGRLRTGDVGYLDADGYLYVVGRRKELIKRGGHSVYPLEVDEALSRCNGVLEAASFSVPHDTLGEDVLAAVVVKAGQISDPAVIHRQLAERLSSYKIPTRIFFVDDLPKNSIGKVLRRELVHTLAARLLPAGETPATDMESALLSVWKDVLRRTDIGVTDNVFQFGADPLRAEMAAGIFRETLSIQVDARALFENPTVRTFAQATPLEKVRA